MIFEVTTVTLQRWLVELEESGALNAAIRDGVILEAKVPRTMGDEFPWRINAAHIVAYEPSDEELKRSYEEVTCHHNGDLLEVCDPTRRDDTLKFYKCPACLDMFPLIGDTDQWEPKVYRIYQEDA